MPENPGRPSLSSAKVSTIGPPEALEADSCARRSEKCRLQPKISGGIAVPLVYFRISFNAGRVTRQIHRPGKEAPWLANRRQRRTRRSVRARESCFAQQEPRPAGAGRMGAGLRRVSFKDIAHRPIPVNGRVILPRTGAVAAGERQGLPSAVRNF